MHELKEWGDKCKQSADNRPSLHSLLHAADSVRESGTHINSTEAFERAHRFFLKVPFATASNRTKNEEALALQLMAAAQRFNYRLPPAATACEHVRTLPAGMVARASSAPLGEVFRKAEDEYLAYGDVRVRAVLGVGARALAGCVAAFVSARGTFTLLTGSRPNAGNVLDTRFCVGSGWRVADDGVVARPILSKTNHVLHNAVLKLKDASYLVLVLVAQCNHLALPGYELLVALTTRPALRGTIESPVFHKPIVFCSNGAQQSSYVVVDPAEIASVHTGYIVRNPANDGVLMLID